VARPESVTETMPSFLRMVRRFWPYLRKERRLIAVSLFALLAEVGLRLLEPWPLKLLFDGVLPPQGSSRSTGLPLLDSLDASTLLIVCAVSVVLFTALRAVATYGNTVGFAMLGNRVLTQVRGHLYNHIQRLSLSFHTKARSGDLVVRVISDVGQLKDVAVTALLPMVAHVLILVSMLGLMLWLNWKLALLALLTVPLFWLSTARLGKRIQQAARKQRKREGAMASTASETIGAIRVVQALSLEETLAGSFLSQNKESLKQDAKASKLSASLERTVDVLISISTGLVLWYGGTLAMQNAMTAGDLLIFLTYLKNTFKPVRDFAKYTGRLAKASAAGERVLDILEREPEVRDMPGALPAPPLKGAVAFQNVNFEYEAGHPVLRDVNLNIEPGQHVALVGASGNGKSTLVSMILRLYDPTSGAVTIDGKDIRGFTLASLRSQVSVVMQDTVLFAATAKENIAYGASEATDEEVEAAARLANAHDFIMQLPEGYDTVLGERGATLSNGQRQRISIARAAIRKAPILILDEPTTGLDEENEREVMQALNRLMEGKTTFLITHKLEQVRSADLILVLEGSRIVEQGTHQELLAQEGSYAHLYSSARREQMARTSLAVPVAAGGLNDAESGMHATLPLPHEKDKHDLQADLATIATPKTTGKAQADDREAPEEENSGPGGKIKRLALLSLIGFALIGLAAFGLNMNSGKGVVVTGKNASAAPPSTNSLVVRSAVTTPLPLEIAQASISRSVVEGRNVITFSRALAGSISLAWSPDNKTLAIGSMDHSVRLLDTSNGKVTTLRGHTEPIYSLAWSPDGTTLATGSWDRSVRLWSADGRAISTLGGHTGYIAGVAWMPDGRTLGAVSSNVNVTLWDTQGRLISAHDGEGDLLLNLGWSPDGKTFATGGNDAAVRVWGADGSLQKLFVGHSAAVYTVAWSPDGKILASGSEDRTVRLWSPTGEQLATMPGHTNFINWVAWSPDGATVASAGDSTVRLWSRQGASIATLPHSGGLAFAASWTLNGKKLASIVGDSDENHSAIWLWDMASQGLK
jgi:ATP-binding cassette subfamily B protein